MADAEEISDAVRAGSGAEARCIGELVAAASLVGDLRIERVDVGAARKRVAVAEGHLTRAESGRVARGAVEARAAAVPGLAQEAAHGARIAHALHQRHGEGRAL